MSRPTLLSRAAILLILTQPLACPSNPAPPAASAEPVKTASAPVSASASASAAAPAMTHLPGTVPPPPAKKAGASQPDAGAPVPPTFARLPVAKSRKAAMQVNQVTLTGKGALLAITGAAGFELIDAATGAGSAISHVSPDAFALSADESLLAIVAAGSVSLWDVAKGALRHTWPDAASNVTFSEDGKMLAIAGESLLLVRDTATGKEIMKAVPEVNPFGIAFGAKGKELVVTGNNTQVAVYAIDSGAKLPGGGGADTSGTFGIAVSPDGRFAAASAPAGHGLQVFDVHAWGPRTLVVVPEGACQEHVGPTFSSNGRFVYAYGGRRWVKGFEAGSWKPYASYHAPPGRDVASAAADLSRVVLTRNDDRDPAVINVGNSAETKLERPFADTASYTISDDGLHVASTSGGAVRVWSAKTGKVEYEEQP